MNMLMALWKFSAYDRIAFTLSCAALGVGALTSAKLFTCAPSAAIQNACFLTLQMSLREFPRPLFGYQLNRAQVLWGGTAPRTGISWGCPAGKRRCRRGGPGGHQVEREPIMYRCCKEGQRHRGLRQEESCRQVRGDAPTPSFSAGECCESWSAGSSSELPSAGETWTESPAKGHKDDEGTGASHMRKGERAGPVQPGEGSGGSWQCL